MFSNERWDRRRRRNRRAFWSLVGWGLWFLLMFGLLVVFTALTGPG